MATVAGAVTDDSNAFIRNMRIDDTTKGLKVLVVGGSAGPTLQTNGTPNGSQSLLNLVQGTNITLTDNGSGSVTIAASGGGTPGGLNTQVQYNNSGAFAGISGATTNGTILSLTNPLIGGATITTSTINGNTFTTGTGVLTLGAAKTLTVNNTLTLTGTDGSSVAFGTGGTVAYTGNNLSVFATTTSAQLAGVISDETGSGALVFANSPTLITPVLGAATGTSLQLSGLTISSAVATDASKNLVSVTNTGTGNNVLATSPTLVTPALGTPTALVATNATGTATGLTSGITNALASATTTVNVSSATAPSSGQVLTATSGTAATWQSPSGGIPKMVIATLFETSGRFSQAVTGGTITFGSNGFSLDTTVTSGRFANLGLPVYGGGLAVFNPWTGSPAFSFSGSFSVLGASCSTYMGIGPITVAAAGHTFTNAHIGFKIVGTSLSATQADGTTENTSVLATLAAGDGLDLIVQVNGTASATYYYRQNGGALSAGTTLTGNIPTGDNTTLIQISASNNNNAARVLMNPTSISYQR